MKDATISVRLPSALVNELKELTKKNNYLDLSEQVRDILREKCTRILTEPAKKEPEAVQVNEKQRLVENLQKILNELKKEL